MKNIFKFKKLSLLDMIKYKMIPPKKNNIWWKLYIGFKFTPFWMKAETFYNSYTPEYKDKDWYMKKSKEECEMALKHICDTIKSSEEKRKENKIEKGSVKEWYVIENL